MTSKAMEKVDYVEFYVGSAKQWAFYHQYGLGFRITGYSGPETGVRDRTSYMVEQGKTKIMITSSLVPDSAISNHVKLHGDGVKDIAIRVNNLDETLNELKERKIVKHDNPVKVKSDQGNMETAKLYTYGETVHTLMDYGEFDSALPPGFESLETQDGFREAGVTRYDHIVGNVEENRMDNWVDYYVEGMGFEPLISFDDKDISTQYSALKSKVVHYNNRKIVFPINEPARGLKKSQIQEYLDYYHMPGVQHIALHTENIISTVNDLKKRGIQFQNTPDSYYKELPERVGEIDEDMAELQKLNILVDRDDDGYLLQIFTKPTGDRPTFFYEIIQRKGATSFGKGNFKALFESIERDQARRGNL
ncbi:MAG: 4-hydroxyphenylpyruvate dioxygenase [Cuniculiplasma sp.]